MPLYKYVIEEHNGEQEYRHEQYMIAPDAEIVRQNAVEEASGWYDDAEPNCANGWEIEGGAIAWIFDTRSVEEVHELVVFDLEKRVDVHIPLVLLPADPVVQEYLKEDGNRCPKCKSYDVEGGHVEMDSGGAWQNIHCSDCGARWIDIYHLVGFELEEE